MYKHPVQQHLLIISLLISDQSKRRDSVRFSLATYTSILLNLYSMGKIAIRECNEYNVVLLLKAETFK